MRKEEFLDSLGESDLKEELKNCEIENMVIKPYLSEKLRKIVSCANQKGYDDAYKAVSYLLSVILYEYMELDLEEFCLIDAIEYFEKVSEKQIVSALISINGEFHMIEKPNKNDTIYLLMKVCCLYNDLLGVYGEKDFQTVE